MSRPLPPWLDVPLLNETCPLPLDTPFTRAQAIERGVTRRQFQILRERELVKELTHGAYAVTQLRDTIESRARALQLVVPDAVLVVDRTAAWLHGVDALPRSAAYEPVPLELVSRNESRTRRAGVRGGIRNLLDSDVTQVEGMRVTTPLRTALDLGRSLRRSDAFAALCSFLRHGLAHGDLQGQLPRFRRMPGVVQLRELAPLATGLPESPPEAVLLLACWDAGVESAVPQQWEYDDDGRPCYRCDITVPELRLRFEYQGVAAHRSPEKRAADADRKAWLEARGWCVVEVWAADLFGPGVDPLDVVYAGVRTARARLGGWCPEGEFL